MDAATPLMTKMLMALFSAVVPTKMWFAPGQPVTVKVDQATTLVATTFDGQAVAAGGSADVAAGATADLHAVFPGLDAPGTYLVYADPKGKSAPADFVGTPLVVEVLVNKELPPSEPNYGKAMVTKVEPLQYVQMKTSAGPITEKFYYDVAPNTVDAFLRLCGQGYYDGVTFHRVIKAFMIQGGDPTGTGNGGPGYTQGAEFNAHQHLPGVLSMARQGDPIEQTGAMPGEHAANSAGSQFFICLDYNGTKALDNKYTAFGQVTAGMDAVDKIGQTPTSGPPNDRPTTPQTIDSAEVVPVTPGHDPYMGK